ncbi:MAG: glycosyltransferase family 2 protein [Gemmatimonadaceae bacterium]|nr:glycosyltransferase family 2 protein [Gemmatimonadaceae bacterium]
MPPKVYVVILNYRTWTDTVECLESLCHTSHRPFEVIVADNASGDGSLDRIREAVDGRLNFPLHYLQSAFNGGFAAGNNIGLRYALAAGDGRYFWLLNSDTVVTPEAMSALVGAAEDDHSRGRKIGQYGSKLLYHARPHLIQAVGGSYNKWFGVTKELGNLQRDTGQFDVTAPTPDILIGASLFVSSLFLQETGLMCEDYFLYFEEHDWAVRGARRGFGLRVVPGSVIYHKQGVSIGAVGGDRQGKSVLSDFYSFRNRLLFTLRFFPYCLPTVYLGCLGVAVNRARRRQWNRLPMMLRLMCTFFRRPMFNQAS